MISLSSKHHRTWSRSTFPSTYFAGWGGMNIGSMSCLPTGRAHHARTSKPNFGRNKSAALAQKRSDRDILSLAVSRFPDPVREMADSYSTLLESACYREARNEPRRLYKDLSAQVHHFLTQPWAGSR